MGRILFVIDRIIRTGNTVDIPNISINIVGAHIFDAHRIDIIFSAMSWLILVCFFLSAEGANSVLWFLETYTSTSSKLGTQFSPAVVVIDVICVLVLIVILATVQFVIRFLYELGNSLFGQSLDGCPCYDIFYR